MNCRDKQRILHVFKLVNYAGYRSRMNDGFAGQ